MLSHVIVTLLLVLLHDILQRRSKARPSELKTDSLLLGTVQIENFKTIVTWMGKNSLNVGIIFGFRQQ